MNDQKYIRDPHSKAIVNQNLSERDRIQKNRERARKAAELESRVDELEKQVAELKQLILNGTEI